MKTLVYLVADNDVHTDQYVQRKKLSYHSDKDRGNSLSSCSVGLLHCILSYCAFLRKNENDTMHSLLETIAVCTNPVQET